MSIQPIHQIKAGDIILPEQGFTPLYVTSFERDAKNTIINVLGHPVLESAMAYSGSIALPITDEALKSGSLFKARMASPMVVVSRDALTSVKVLPDAYYAEYYATTTEQFKQQIHNAEEDIRLGDSRIIDIEVSDRVKPRDYGRYLEQKGGKFDDNVADDGETRRKYTKRANAVAYKKDMYLETAVENGILPQRLYEVFAQDSKSFTTLHDVFNALNDGDLGRFVDMANEQRSMPSVQTELPEEDEALNAEISRRETVLNSDSIIRASENIPLDYALEKGWIEQRTFDVFTQQDDPDGNMNAETLNHAFQTVGAHSYHLETFKNPSSGYKLGKNIRAAIIEDVEGAYQELASDRKQSDFITEIKGIRSAFFSYALSNDKGVLNAPDMNQNYTSKVKKQAANETADIAANRPQQLNF